jgi:subtilase family serine protease
VNGTIRLVAPLVAALAIAACSTSGTSNVPTSGASQVGSSASHRAPQWQARNLARADCPNVIGRPTCMALRVLTNGVPAPCSPTAGCGFTPAELEAAYGLTSALGNGSGHKVAVIEAGDLANASSDLSTYRTQYGLGTASFFKYNENGQQSNYPASCEDYGWCGETALDIDMVSAACPKCTIFLMEAKDQTSISDFETAEKEAVTLGATVVSNSWSCPNDWDCGDTNFGSYFDTAGVAYLASTGDRGYDTIGGPSNLASVVGVGGTQLSKSGSAYTESVWADASAGCSQPTVVGSPGVPKPSWQHDPDCSYRTDGDVSAESGCAPGVAVYVDVYGGWSEYCGTSVASPFLAGVIGLKGNSSIFGANGGKHFWTLSHRKLKKLHDITSGSDGSCGGEYLCTAGTNQFGQYSGPGGWGTPKTDKDF